MSDTTLIDLTPVAAEKVIELSEGAAERAYLHVFPAGQGCCRTMYGLAFMAEAGTDFEVFEAHAPGRGLHRSEGQPVRRRRRLRMPLTAGSRIR